MKIKNAESPIEIVWDKSGIPHVFAKGIAAAYRGMATSLVKSDCGRPIRAQPMQTVRLLTCSVKNFSHKTLSKEPATFMASEQVCRPVLETGLSMHIWMA